MVDTGSGHHLVPEGGRTEKERTTTHEGQALKLATANGTITSNSVARSSVSDLGALDVEVRVLKRTPRVLSVASLVKDGAEFRWNETGATLWYGGKWHELEIQHGVPLLALPAFEETLSQ